MGDSTRLLFEDGYNKPRRDVAQLGSALPWGGRGHGFESHRSDQNYTKTPHNNGVFLLFVTVFFDFIQRLTRL